MTAYAKILVGNQVLPIKHLEMRRSLDVGAPRFNATLAIPDSSDLPAIGDRVHLIQGDSEIRSTTTWIITNRRVTRIRSMAVILEIEAQHISGISTAISSAISSASTS